jgi:hypothetical protein
MRRHLNWVQAVYLAALGSLRSESRVISHPSLLEQTFRDRKTARDLVRVNALGG